ncbi:hypothetical protein [Gilvibacter sp. SZ-19]|uniref:hypothetical protein n=1 Tax=unclassified Gilvibacter TaxID=2625242 RepID=UPI0012FA078E|nr:hypothetical protein [Gilvibacter sp. SZ-19]
MELDLKASLQIPGRLLSIYLAYNNFTLVESNTVQLQWDQSINTFGLGEISIAA